MSNETKQTDPNKSKSEASKLSVFQKAFLPLLRILGWSGATVLLITALALAAFLTKEGEKETKPALTQGDFAPLLAAVHTAWTKLPANRVASAELKAFDQSRSGLQAALASVDWTHGLKQSETDKLQAIAQSVGEDSAKLDQQLATEDSDLKAAVAKVQAEANRLTDRVEQAPSPSWNQQVLTAYSEAIKALAKLVTDWPFVTIAGLILLFAYADKMGGISNIFGGVQSIKIAGGSEIIFSPSQADERSKTANDVFASYRKKATEEFAAMAKGEQIATRLKNVCEQRIKAYLHGTTEACLKGEGMFTDPDKQKADKETLDKEVEKRWSRLRFTVFIKDLLFDNTLCQLVDYYPAQKDPENPAKTIPSAGRAWSLRYGMIGRVWRMQQSHSETSVTTNEDLLVTEWGMTRDEVKNFVSRKQTFTTVVLKDGDEPFALFYMDSDLQDAFALGQCPDTPDPCDDLHQLVAQACKEFGLTRALQNVAKQIENRKLDIRIYS